MRAVGSLVTRRQLSWNSWRSTGAATKVDPVAPVAIPDLGGAPGGTVDGALDAVSQIAITSSSNTTTTDLGIESLLNQPLTMPDVEYGSIMEALSNMDSILPLTAKYMTLLGPVVDGLNLTGIGYPLSIITVITAVRLSGTLYRQSRQQYNARTQLVQGIQTKMVDVDEYRMLLNQQSPLQRELGTGSGRPQQPAALKRFEAKRTRFERVVEKTVDMDWDAMKRELHAKGSLKAMADLQIRPQYITIPAFMFAGYVGRTLNGVNITGMNDSLLWFNAMNTCTPAEAQMTGMLMGGVFLTARLAMMGDVATLKLNAKRLTWILPLSFFAPYLLCSKMFVLFNTPALIQASFLFGAIGNQFITAAMERNYFGFQEKFGHEPVDQFRNKIKDALRADPVIGPDLKRKELKEALAAKMDNEPDEAGDGFWQKFKYFHFHYKLDGYSTSEALSRAFKKASGYNANDSFSDVVQKKRDNADNQMTELFPYDIPKVDELKKQLLKRQQMESTSFENKRITETTAYWNAINSKIAPEIDITDQNEGDNDKDNAFIDDIDLFDFGERLPDEELAWRVYEKKSKANEIYETVEPVHAPWWAKSTA